MVSKISKCQFDGCDRKSRARGCCSKHYQQLPDIKKKKSTLAKKAQKTEKRKQQKRVCQKRYYYTIKAAYGVVLRWAKRKNKECLFTEQQYEEFRKLPCVRCQNKITGSEMGFELTDKKGDLSISNITPMCRICKLIKPHSEFDPFKHAKKILRRHWKRTPYAALAIQKSRSQENGNYICRHCGGEFTKRQIDLDHIEPIHATSGVEIDMNQFVSRLFCTEDNLQVLCKECHKNKTRTENAIRRENKNVLR